MKSPEELKAEREARLIANLSSPRTGYIPETTKESPASSPGIQGLKLSDVQLWPIERFKPHPSNHLFDSAKTETYWRDLKRDILEAGTILNPLIALPDGTVIEGHSRLRIAIDLKAEGHDLGKIPVRVVASAITPEEAERRVYLGNLSRFELDEKTRLELYLKVWPGYFLGAKPGRPGKGDTVSPFSTKAEIAAATGKSERQVQRDRQVVRKAVQIARAKGKSNPDTEDISEARNKAARQRRGKTRLPKGAAVRAAPGRVMIQLPRGHAELVLRIIRRSKPASPMQAAVIREIEKALR